MVEHIIRCHQRKGIAHFLRNLNIRVRQIEDKELSSRKASLQFFNRRGGNVDSNPIAHRQLVPQWGVRPCAAPGLQDPSYGDRVAAK